MPPNLTQSSNAIARDREAMGRGGFISKPIGVVRQVFTGNSSHSR
jgi:hypothetical protein